MHDVSRGLIATQYKGYELKALEEAGRTVDVRVYDMSSHTSIL